MFNWFSQGDSADYGLDHMRAEFGQMLDAGRHIFDAATNALLGGTDIDVIRKDLFDTDKRINQAERQIRREIVVHASVHGATSFPACLVLMSVVKDAERVGDYAKNLFDLAELSDKSHDDEFKADMIRLKDRISKMMAGCRESFDKQDAEAARVLIEEAGEIKDHCDDQIAVIVRADEQVDLSAKYALAYRYFKRTASHVLNVLTSIVQPLDKLDYFDEEQGNHVAD